MTRSVRAVGPILLVSLACLALPGCGDKPEDFLAAGKSHLQNNDPTTAVIELKNAASARPEDPEVRYFLGLAQHRIGDMANARAQLMKARDLGFDINQVQPAIAALLVDMGATDDAIKETAIDKITDPSAKSSLLASRGDALLAKDKRDEAAQAFEAALAASASNSNAKLGRARVALAAGDRAAATKVAEEVLAADPSSLSAMYLRGGLMAADGKFPEAAALLDKVVAARPLDFRAYGGLVSSLIRSGDEAGAVQRLETLKKRAPNAPPTRYLSAMVAFQRGDMSLAREQVRMVLKDVPDNVLSLVLAGQVEQALHNMTMAERHLEKALAIAPDNDEARRLLAVIYAKAGKIAAARDLLKNLSADSATTAPMLALAGEVAMAEGKGAQAAELLGRAVALQPKEVGAYRARLGEALLISGDTARGLDELKAALEDPVHGLSAGAALAGAYVKSKDLNKAREVAESLIKRFPKQAKAHEVLARVHLAAGDQTAAKGAFEKAAEIEPTSLDAARFLATLDASAGQFESAKARFKKVLAGDPRREEATLMLVKLLRNMGAPTDEVLATMDAAITADPNAMSVRATKAEYLLELGRPKNSIDEAQKAIASLGDEVRILYILGRAQHSSGDYSGAHTTFGKLTTLDSRSPLPHMGQMQVYLAEKNYRAATASAQKAIQLRPDFLPARLSLVEIFLASGQLEEARAQAQGIQKQWPKDAAGYLAEARVLQTQKTTGLAEEVLRKALSQSDSPIALTRLYGVLKSQKRDAEAEALADTWVAAHSQNAAVLSGLAEYRLIERDYAGAEKWYRKLMALRPNDAAGLNNLAWVLGKLKNPEAEVIGKKALSLAPESGPLLDTLGGIYLDAGKASEAVPLLKRAAEKMPETASVQVKYAQALAQTGKKDEAKVVLSNARKAATSEAMLQEIANIEKSF